VIFERLPAQSIQAAIGRKFDQSVHPVPEPKQVCCTQCCQMVYFQTKNPNLGKFWKVFPWKTLKFFIAILSILWPNGIFNGQLVHFVGIRYIFTVLVFCTEKNLATLVVQVLLLKKKFS
jgi:hypothetical protein